MQFIPWRYVADWKCISCGDCCRFCSVVLTFHEWLQIVKNFGVEQTISGVSKLFIRRKQDGSCIFLRQLSTIYFCGLQYMKPKACKIWPFKVLGTPKFGHTSEAAYQYGEKRLFLYADPTCQGLKYGSPSWEFENKTLREFVEIALGLRSEQYKTTADLAFSQSNMSFGILSSRKYANV